MAQELAEQDSSRMKMKVLLILNCILLTIGNCGGPLITRLYYIRGGRRVWLASWLQSVGWPIMLIPIGICYHHRRITHGSAGNTKFFLMEPSLFVPASFIGLLSGLIRQLLFCLRRCAPSGFHLRFDFSLSDDFHCRICFQYSREEKVHLLLHKHRRVAYRRRGNFGISYKWRSSKRWAQKGVHQRILDNSGKRNYIWYHNAIDWVDVQEGQAKHFLFLDFRVSDFDVFVQHIFCTVGMLVSKDFQVYIYINTELIYSATLFIIS